MEPLENIERRWSEEHCRIEGDSIILVVRKQLYRVPLNSCDTCERILATIRQLISMDAWFSLGHIDAFISLACKYHKLLLSFAGEEETA